VTVSAIEKVSKLLCYVSNVISVNTRLNDLVC
jgi:hypothetical protein